mmetsp:Transcript_566/g.1542  ORF Transcript_566/g.1542 Transcript_566/m.1542 type:complete len:265 (-) Transcript_566:223-1017(-)
MLDQELCRSLLQKIQASQTHPVPVDGVAIQILPQERSRRPTTINLSMQPVVFGVHSEAKFIACLSTPPHGILVHLGSRIYASLTRAQKTKHGYSVLCTTHMPHLLAKLPTLCPFVVRATRQQVLPMRGYVAQLFCSKAIKTGHCTRLLQPVAAELWVQMLVTLQPHWLIDSTCKRIMSHHTRAGTPGPRRCTTVQETAERGLLLRKAACRETPLCVGSTHRKTDLANWFDLVFVLVVLACNEANNTKNIDTKPGNDYTPLSFST